MIGTQVRLHVYVCLLEWSHQGSCLNLSCPPQRKTGGSSSFRSWGLQRKDYHWPCLMCVNGWEIITCPMKFSFHEKYNLRWNWLIEAEEREWVKAIKRRSVQPRNVCGLIVNRCSWPPTQHILSRWQFDLENLEFACLYHFSVPRNETKQWNSMGTVA